MDKIQFPRMDIVIDRHHSRDFIVVHRETGEEIPIFEVVEFYNRSVHMLELAYIRIKELKEKYEGEGS